MTVGSLRAILRLDNDKFNKGIDQSGSKFKRAKRSILSGAKNMAMAMKGPAAAVAAVVATLGALSNATVKYGDEVAKTARKTGQGVEQLWELRLAFGQAGGELPA